MKKLVKEVVASGVALFLAHTVFNLLTIIITVNTLPCAVHYGVVGLLTVRLYNTFRA